MDTYCKALSLFVVSLLDNLGYSQVMIAKRRDFCKKQPHTFTREIEHNRWNFVSGSKGEGITRVYESDWDLIILDYNAFCCENGYNHYPCRSSNPSVFKMNTELCSPGYTLLLPLNHTPVSLFNDCLVSFDQNYQCVSSLLFVNKVKKSLIENSVLGLLDDRIKRNYKSREGPSVPYEQTDGTKHDYVHSLFCYCPSVLHEWVVRHRPHDWPPWDLRVEVVSMGANLCPAGNKQDAFHDLEWRICFNLGELRLFESLNETQTKLYIVLKMMLKDLLKPQNKELTSYIMKNVVFWVCEMYPQSKFTLDSLIYWVRKALSMLKWSIAVNCLPYYMIPGRNLLRPLTEDRRQDLLHRISHLIQNPRVVFQCKKMHFGMKLYDMTLLSAWRNDQDEREENHLQYCLIFNSLHHGPELSPEATEAAIQRLHYLRAKVDMPYPEPLKHMKVVALAYGLDVM